MAKYALIVDGIVVQTQPYEQKDFIRVPKDTVCGQIQDGKKFINPPPPPKTWEEVKQERTRLLAESDWTQMPDVVENGRLSQEKQDSWKQYRQDVYQAVVAVEEGSNNPDDVLWPQKPE